MRIRPNLAALAITLLTPALLGPQQTQGQPKRPDPSPKAATLVQRFYHQVFVRKADGIYEPELKIIQPYLSKGLRQKIKNFNYCADDWERQPGHDEIKSPFSIEMGILTGTLDDERRPSFTVGRTETERDGSFLVHVSFTQIWPPPTKPEVWEVTAHVVMEAAHPVIDDVNYIYSGDEKNMNSSLSSYLALPECEGPHLVGH